VADFACSSLNIHAALFFTHLESTMKTLQSLLAVLLLTNTMLVQTALAESPSEASAGASVISVLLPVSLVVIGSEALGNSFANISKALNDETRWTVTGMNVEGDKTLLTLKSQDQKSTLAVSVPTTQVTKADVRLGKIVEAKRVGQHSFELDYNSRPLGVIADSGMVHSKKLN
jgi:ATPase subunit of ABC transporter with duplicated ATPase domains